MRQFVYVTSPESQQIHVLKLNTEGILKIIQIVNTSGQAQPITIHPNKNFLYIGVRPNPRIVTYTIKKENGVLNFINEFFLPSRLTYISIDHKGCFLFGASYSAGCIFVIRMEKNIPVEITDVIEGLEGCHSVNISPDGYTVWVPILKQDCICIFNINNNGKLIKKPLSVLKTIKGAGPRHMVFHPKYQYAYTLNELNSSIDVWRLNNLSQNITCIQTLNIMPANFTGPCWAADIHITSNGHYLYACDRTASILTIFHISPYGDRLTIKGFKLTEKQPRSFNIDSQDKFLISAGQKSHHISIYEIENVKGLLKERGRYTVGQGPAWVEIISH